MNELAVQDPAQRKAIVARLPEEFQPLVASLASHVGPVFWWAADVFLVRLQAYRKQGLTKADLLLVAKQFTRCEVQAQLKRDTDFLALFAQGVTKVIAERKKLEKMKQDRADEEEMRHNALGKEQIQALCRSFTGSTEEDIQDIARRIS